MSLLNNINTLIKITEDNIFVQAKNYGVSGIVDNFLTKLFSSNVTSNFEELIRVLDTYAEHLNISLIRTKDTEEILNRAIHKCKEEDGKCIINLFFDAVNQIITLIIDKLIDLLVNDVNDLKKNKIAKELLYHSGISTFEELAEFFKEETKYILQSKYRSYIFLHIYQVYINAINTDNFNKFFFKMRGSVIDTSFIREKMRFLDNYVVHVINNKTGKSVSVTHR